MKKLHPGAKWLFRINTYLFWVLLIIISIGWIIPAYIGISKNTASFLPILVYAIIINIILMAILGEVYSRMAYNRWFYEFTPSNLKIERGIIWKKYSNVPYQRVQNVDITRGIIARICGFSSVNIQTAGYASAGGRSVHSEGYIPAVNMKEAEHIRDFLMKKISKRSHQGL